LLKPPFTLAGRGGFFIVSAIYIFLAVSPQEIFISAETISVHRDSNRVLL